MKHLYIQKEIDSTSDNFFSVSSKMSHLHVASEIHENFHDSQFWKMEWKA